jgi:UDPglucose--hexose-1-phosphate uridylyltransferase
MSLLRYDATTNDWVIFAHERARRPHEHARRNATDGTAESAPAPCPFCPGNEHLTGPEIYAARDNGSPNAPGWRTRVVANKFPALRIEEDHRRREEGTLFRAMGGCGAHEVIIESPDHERPLAHQPLDQVEAVLRTLQFRFNDLMRDPRFQTIILFKNHGEGAGTSLRHPHWQLIATPVVPRLVRLKHAVATDYFDQTGDCLYCVLLAEELAGGDRVVAQNDHFAAVAPYASHAPFETWILPKVHQSSYGWVSAPLLRSLAEILQTVLLKLDNALDNPDFNLTINTVPRGEEDKKYYLWHIEVLPRLTRPAGFELGSGMSINTVLPEDAARWLRDAEPK